MSKTNSNQITKSDFGLIGLAVMGQNLVLNMNDHGYTVAVFNRTATKTNEFLSTTAKDTQVVAPTPWKSWSAL